MELYEKDVAEALADFDASSHDELLGLLEAHASILALDVPKTTVTRIQPEEHLRSLSHRFLQVREEFIDACSKNPKLASASKEAKSRLVDTFIVALKGAYAVDALLAYMEHQKPRTLSQVEKHADDFLRLYGSSAYERMRLRHVAERYVDEVRRNLDT